VTDVAVVTQDPRFGGGALAQTEAFVRAAADLGHTPRVLHPRFLPVVDSLAQVAQSRRIARAVREASSAWVVAAAAPYGYGASRSGKPYAAWIGTSLGDEWAARRPHLDRARRVALALNAPLLRRLERHVLLGATRLFATTPSSRDGLAAAAAVAPEQIGILPIPVDLELYAAEPDESWLARLERPTVIFVGRGDDPRKNVRLLLEAWPRVRSALPPAHLRLVGRRPLGPLPEGVEAVGEVASVADELRRASLFVLPSLQEGFGIVVAEALASGVPVVVTPCGGPEDLVVSSAGGTVVADFAPNTLADAITAALAGHDRLSEQRARGRSYVETHHSRDRLRARLAAAFAEFDDA
jgi:glycosyltransferase involved in cell wall biosynthesis